MEKEFILYEQALALKELGFDEPCLANYFIDVIGETVPHFRYNNRISEAFSIDEGVWFNHNLNKEYVWSTPLYQQAFRWFREKYGLWQIVMQNTDKDWTYDIMTIAGMTDYKIFDVFDTYEEAELECLKKLIEIAKQEQK